MSVVILSVMLIVTGVQVLARYVFHYSFFWSEELTCFLFVWTGFIGGSIAYRSHAHLSLDLFAERINSSSSVVRTVFLILKHGTLISVLFLIAFYGFSLVRTNMDATSIALGVNMGIVYLPVPLGACFMIIHQLAEIEEMAKVRITSNKTDSLQKFG